MSRAHTRSPSNLSLQLHLYGSLIVLTTMAIDLLSVCLLATQRATPNYRRSLGPLLA